VTGHRAGLGAAALGFLLFFSMIASVIALRASRGWAGPIHQPISFNHRKHVQDNSLECSTCHQFYEKEVFSGLPTAEVCEFCHLEPQGKSAQELELVRLLKAGAPLDWKPLFRQPPHVYYSHRRHVVTAKLECDTCHGEIGQSVQPPSSVRRLRMQDCIDCHQRRGVATGCTNCHR
jgi:hypothetical protein